MARAGMKSLAGMKGKREKRMWGDRYNNFALRMTRLHYRYQFIELRAGLPHRAAQSATRSEDHLLILSRALTRERGAFPLSNYPPSPRAAPAACDDIVV